MLLINGIGKEGMRAYSKFTYYYGLGVFFIGVSGMIILRLTLEINGDYVTFFGIIYLLVNYLSAIGPAFLNNPDRALELGIVSQSHYVKYY